MFQQLRMVYAGEAVRVIRRIYRQERRGESTCFLLQERLLY